MKNFMMLSTYEAQEVMKSLNTYVCLWIANNSIPVFVKRLFLFHSISNIQHNKRIYLHTNIYWRICTNAKIQMQNFMIYERQRAKHFHNDMTRFNQKICLHAYEWAFCNILMCACVCIVICWCVLCWWLSACAQMCMHVWMYIL